MPPRTAAKKDTPGSPGTRRSAAQRSGESRAPNADERGLVLLKIDGLSRNQFSAALKGKRLPHLRGLIERQGYRLKSFYSGMPSTTPAVQAELFYGIRTSVPAMTFFDRRRGRQYNLLLPGSAGDMARRLERQGEGLLKQGTAYVDIYTGGAAEARYCTQTMTLRSLRQIGSSLKLMLMFVFRPLKFLRMIAYTLLELGLAFYDFFRGVTRRKNIIKELKFIPTRVLICILLRELVCLRVQMDVKRGVRIVHASFLGYDEQAHRRGPDSAFAHWTLKGIDAAVGAIHRAALQAKSRNYRLVVYADHGQEAVAPYEKHAGKTLRQAVEDAVEKNDQHKPPGKSGAPPHNRFSGQRLQGLFGRSRRLDAPNGEHADRLRVTALGPLCHVYLPHTMTGAKKRLAQRLVNRADIPLVLFIVGTAVIAVTVEGRFALQTHAKEILGADHPFVEWVAADLSATCRHPDAGDLVISGWSPRHTPLSFAVENGAHGGPGKEETRGFILLPEEMDTAAPVLRPLDLRSRVLDFC